ncbi:MAG: universal stress protein [Methanobacterium sp.]|nr:universal stress protein [Methanobacterium sp.]
MYKKIMIPTDGSEHSKRAAEHAIWIANSSGADILVLNVFETSSLNPIRSRELKKDMKELWKEDARENLKDVLKVLKSNGLELNVDSQIKEGQPAEKILETIDNEKVDLVVIGSSGKHALDRFFIGSVAEKVVRSSKSPVMVIH